MLGTGVDWRWPEAIESELRERHLGLDAVHGFGRCAEWIGRHNRAIADGFSGVGDCSEEEKGGSGFGPNGPGIREIASGPKTRPDWRFGALYVSVDVITGCGGSKQQVRHIEDFMTFPPQ